MIIIYKIQLHFLQFNFQIGANGDNASHPSGFLNISGNKSLKMQHKIIF